jgi:hypothetical protein
VLVLPLFLRLIETCKLVFASRSCLLASCVCRSATLQTLNSLQVPFSTSLSLLVRRFWSSPCAACRCTRTIRASRSSETCLRATPRSGSEFCVPAAAALCVSCRKSRVALTCVHVEPKSPIRMCSDLTLGQKFPALSLVPDLTSHPSFPFAICRSLYLVDQRRLSWALSLMVFQAVRPGVLHRCISLISTLCARAFALALRPFCWWCSLRCSSSPTAR